MTSGDHVTSLVVKRQDHIWVPHARHRQTDGQRV